MQRGHFGSNEGPPGGNPVQQERKLKRPAAESSVGHEEAAADEDELPPRTRRTMKDAQQPKTGPSGSTAGAAVSGVRAVLQDFMEQQQRLDARRQEATARHAQERLVLEQQWRQEMQRLERERVMMEQAWREREEQRRVRDDARAERRDALLTNLLNKLLHDDF